MCVRSCEIPTRAHPPQVENSLSQPAEGPLIFPKGKKNIMLNPIFPELAGLGTRIGSSPAKTLIRNTSRFIPFSVLDSSRCMHPLSFPPQPSPTVFQTQTCSRDIWLCQVRSKSHQCALRMLRARVFTWLLTLFSKVLSLLSLGFPVSIIPRFLEKKKGEGQSTANNTCPLAAVVSLQAQSTAGQGTGRGSGHLPRTISGNWD